MKRKDPYSGSEREVRHYLVIGKDLNPDDGFKEKDTWRYDLYEQDPEAFHTRYTRFGEERAKGVAHVIFSRGGFTSKEIAEYNGQQNALLLGYDVRGQKPDEPEPKQQQTKR